MQAAHAILLFESAPTTLALCLAAAFVGLFVGDILYGLAQRLTHGEPVLSTTVRCDECGYAIPLRERLPILSWIRRGSCPHCGSTVSLSIPVCQLTGAGVITSITLRYGLTMQTLELLAFACAMMTVMLTTLKDYSIRTSVLLFAIVVRIAYLDWLFVTGGDAYTQLLASLAGAAFLGLPLAIAVFLANAMLMRDMTGMGTVRLVAVVGFYLGWQQGLFAMAIAFCIGTAVWAVSPSKRVDVEVAGAERSTEDERGGQGEPSPRDLKPTREEDIAEPMRLIPFAPSIVLGCWIVVLIGAGMGAWNAPII